MGQQQDATYYDAMFTESDHYNRAAKDAAWFPLWQAVAEYVPAENGLVLDIGCGPGQFYEVVNDRCQDYLGIDFSPAAVQRARDRAPGARFEIADLDTLDFHEPRYAQFNTFVFCEVLEHVEGDLAVLQRVPKDKRVILTVPSFDDPSHVRWFAGLSDVLDRYSRVLDIRVARRLAPWFLLMGFTKGPSR